MLASLWRMIYPFCLLLVIGTAILIGHSLYTRMEIAESDRRDIVRWSEKVRLHPTNVSARISLAYALERYGDDKEAVQDYIEIIKVKPDSYPAHYQLGILLYNRGEQKAAYNHWNYILRLSEHRQSDGDIMWRRDIQALIQTHPITR